MGGPRTRNKEKANRVGIAEESSKTKKAREKLKKQLARNGNKITPQALEEATQEIHRWTARHASQRIILKTKSISLFDENQNSIKPSRSIQQLRELLAKKLSKRDALE